MNSQNQFINKLSTEIFSIRKFLWIKAKMNEKYQEKTVLSSLNNRQDFLEKLLESKMLMYQSYYCFNVETTLLLQLRSYLLDKFKNINEEPHLYENNYHLHFIPFFDGAYIKFFSDNQKEVIYSEMRLK